MAPDNEYPPGSLYEGPVQGLESNDGSWHNGGIFGYWDHEDEWVHYSASDDTWQYDNGHYAGLGPSPEELIESEDITIGWTDSHGQEHYFTTHDWFDSDYGPADEIDQVHSHYD